MIVYLVVLGLGLLFLYALRDGVLAYQRAQESALTASANKPSTIIHKNHSHCKQIKKAG